MKLARIMAIALVGSLGLAACDDSEDIIQPEQLNIVELAADAGAFETLLVAATAAGLEGTLANGGPFTVFAPNDAAFAKLPAGTVEALLNDIPALTEILTYHVVEGALDAEAVTGQTFIETLNGQSVTVSTEMGVMIDQANVVAADLEASNGIVHVIDEVLLPENRNLVEVASDAGSFSTLIAAAVAAELAETLSSGGPYTVFAPTDEAFAALPAGTVESLLANPEELAQILLYHVVDGRAYSEDVVTLSSVETLQGGSLSIEAANAAVTVDGVTVIATDIQANNGVIHVIDQVLIPGS